MLSTTQKNIGATASIYQSLGKELESKLKFGSDLKLTGMVTETIDQSAELFKLESNACPSKVAGACTFEMDGEQCESPPKCEVGTCPLGEIVDLEESGSGDVIL
jgi:hypothetical protein